MMHKLYTLKNCLRKGLGLLLLAGSLQAAAQSEPFFECVTPASVTTVPAGVLKLPCYTPVSPAYTDFYRHKESYIPGNFSDDPLTGHKTIRVAVHVLQPLSATADDNYKETDEAAIRAWLDKANDYFSTNVRPTDPITLGRDPWITDTRFRLEVASIDYHKQSMTFEDLRNKGLTMLKAKGFFSETNVLHVFVVYSLENTYAGGLTMRDDIETPYMFLNNFYRNSDFRSSPERCANVFLHEIGHTFGLGHVYRQDYGRSSAEEKVDEAELDYLADIFGSDATTKFNWRPYNTADYPAPPDQFGVPGDAFTNNFMAGHVFGHYYSPMQLGRMHRAAHFGNCRNFIYNTYPEDENHDHTGEGQHFPLVITRNETWDFDIKLYSDIVVRSGVTLTITCQVMMPHFGNIIVEPGAKLVVNGGMITSGGKDDFWYGISVLGNRSKLQDIPGAQGIVETKNDAIICNALHAITLGDEVFKDFGKCGGILRAQDTRFINNKHSVAFWSYRNTLLSWPLRAELPNRSYIRNCRFELNDDYPYDKHDNPKLKPLHQITAWEVKGIKIEGCTLENKMSTAKRARIGIEASEGIISFEANFSFTDYCPPGCVRPVPAQIIGFAGGIRAEAVVSRPFTVQNALLKRNGAGVFMEGITGAEISNNEFDVVDGSGISAVPVGIQAYGCNGYKIRYNNFRSSEENQSNTGVDIIEGGSDANEVKSNTYALWHANVARGMNTNGVQDNDWMYSGLQFLCNTNNRYSVGASLFADMFISGSDPGTDGIRLLQGSAIKPAGNAFAPAASPALQRHIYAENILPFTYYYSTDAPAAEKPVNYTPGLVNVVGSSKKPDCEEEDHLPMIGGWNSTISLEQLRAAFADSLWAQGGDPVELVYRGMNSAYAGAELSLYLVSQGRVTDGLDVYDHILRGNPYALNSKELYEFGIGRELLDLLANQYQEQRPMIDINAATADVLRGITLRSRMWPAAKACAWLRFATGEACAIPALPEPAAEVTRKIAPDAGTALLQLRPNPARDYVELEYMGTADAQCSIMDLDGRLLWQGSLSAQSHYKIDVQTWPAGLYLYRLQAPGQVYYGKIVKY